jgi:hypothetical protein
MLVYYNTEEFSTSPWFYSITWVAPSSREWVNDGNLA